MVVWWYFPNMSEKQVVTKLKFIARPPRSNSCIPSFALSLKSIVEFNMGGKNTN